MTKIATEKQYEWAMARVEELLPLVKDDTPIYDSNYIGLVLSQKLDIDPAIVLGV